MTPAAELLLAYYGDDFTGSTDALEFLTRAGIRTALFLEPPTDAMLAAVPGLEAFGVAGLTRALSPDEMEAQLRPAFARLRELSPRHVHYKVCSTFDSSPNVGSIGRAIDVGAGIFRGRYVPLLVGAPALGRYCAFGNLFARVGIGSGGAIHRLDRHPTMSCHPVTPADESDLRLHLAKQTTKRIGLLDVTQLEAGESEMTRTLDDQVSAGAEVVLFDAMNATHLERIGAVIDTEAEGSSGPLFSVGSSGIEMALGACWRTVRGVREQTNWPQAGRVDQLLVVSGSCSGVTAAQIDWAVANGFVNVAIDPRRPDVARAIDETTAAIRAGRSVVVNTGRNGDRGELASAKVIGTAFGQLARSVIGQQKLPRLLVAGGDTSSYAARALGIEAVEMIAPLAPGAPLCRVRAPGSSADRLEVCFKGGQVGAPDFFGAVQRGTP